MRSCARRAGRATACGPAAKPRGPRPLLASQLHQAALSEDPIRNLDSERLEGFLRDPDVGDPDLPGKAWTIAGDQAWFGQAERHRHIRAHTRIVGGSRVCVEAGWHVDGDDAFAGSIDGVDPLGELGLRRPREAHAKDRIDYEL